MKHTRIVKQIGWRETKSEWFFFEKRFLYFFKWKKYYFHTIDSRRYGYRKTKCNFFSLTKALQTFQKYKTFYYKQYKLLPYINENEEVEFYCKEIDLCGTTKELQEYIDNNRKIVFEK